MEKLNLIDENKQIHSDAIELMFDKAITSRYKTIRDYCDEKKYKLNPMILKFLFVLLKKPFMIIFLLCPFNVPLQEQTNDWGGPGEQQVKVTFCRNLLKLSPTIHLDTNHATEFSSSLKESSRSTY